MKNVIGRVYGDFTVVELHAVTSYRTYKCRCNLCGGTKILRESDLPHEPIHARRVCEQKRNVEKKPEPEKKPEKLCDKKDCVYMMTIDYPLKCCHYCIVHGKRRERDAEGNCMSYDNTDEARDKVRRIMRGMA